MDTKVKLNRGRTVVGRTTTDGAGAFAFPGAAPGRHKIIIAKLPVP